MAQASVFCALTQALGVAYMELTPPDAAPPAPHAAAAAPGCLQLLSAAGVRFPCRVARRRGLSPPAVGFTRVELAPGDDLAAQEVHVTVRGCWYSSPAGNHLTNRHGAAAPQQSQPPQQAQDSAAGAAAAAGGGGSLQGSEGRWSSLGGLSGLWGSGVVEEVHGKPSLGHAEAEAWGNGLGAAGRSGGQQPPLQQQQQRAWHGQPRAAAAAGGLRARALVELGPGHVRLSYSLCQGQTALDALSDVLSMLRMQTFLARVECMAPEPSRLSVQHCGGGGGGGRRARRRPAAAAHAAAAAPRVKRERPDDGDGDGGGGDADPAQQSSDLQHGAKRARHEGLGLPHHAGGNGHAGAAANGAWALPAPEPSSGLPHGDGNGHWRRAEEEERDGGGAAAAAQDPEWRWGRNGALRLRTYGLTSATLAYTPAFASLPPKPVAVAAPPSSAHVAAASGRPPLPRQATAPSQDVVVLDDDDDMDLMAMALGTQSSKPRRPAPAPPPAAAAAAAPPPPVAPKQQPDDAPPPQPLCFRVRWASGPAWRALARSASAAAPPPAAATGSAAARGGPRSPTPGPQPPSTPPHSATAAAAAATAAAAQAQAPAVRWPELVACFVSLVADEAPDAPTLATATGGGGDGGQGDGDRQACRGPLAGLLGALQDMASDGEEGLLLDALMLSAQPMAALQRAIEFAAAPSAAAAPAPAVLHVGDDAPFRHEMLVSLPGRAAARGSGGGAAAGKQQQQPEAAAGGGAQLAKALRSSGSVATPVQVSKVLKEGPCRHG